jgi:hypothetical protein
MAAIMAYHAKEEPELLLAWITLSAISTGYSYFWDLKMDWKLL